MGGNGSRSPDDPSSLTAPRPSREWPHCAPCRPVPTSPQQRHLWRLARECQRGGAGQASVSHPGLWLSHSAPGSALCRSPRPLLSPAWQVCSWGQTSAPSRMPGAWAEPPGMGIPGKIRVEVAEGGPCCPPYRAAAQCFGPGPTGPSAPGRDGPWLVRAGECVRRWWAEQGAWERDASQGSSQCSTLLAPLWGAQDRARGPSALLQDLETGAWREGTVEC